MILLGDHNVEKIFQNNFSVRKAIYFSVEYYPLTSASLFWRFFFYFFKNHQDLASNSTNWEFIHRPNFLMLKRNFQWQCPLCCFGMDTPLPEELGTHWDCLRLEVNFQSLGRFWVQSSSPKCFATNAQDPILHWGESRRQWGEEEGVPAGARASHGRPSRLAAASLPWLCASWTEISH